MPTTNVSIYSNPNDGFPGQLFSNGINKQRRFLNKGGLLPVGSAVVASDDLDSLEQGMIQPDGTARKFLGILLDERLYETEIDANGDSCIPGNFYCAVVQEARIKVQAEVPIAVNDPVYFRNAVSANGAITGRFRNDADGGSCVLIPGATWYRATSTPGLAVLDINIP